MIFRHDGGVTHAAFSPDGQRMVTASFDKTARIWNAEDGVEMAALKGHRGSPRASHVQPRWNARRNGEHDGTARIWNAESGEQMFVLHQPGDAHIAIFSPDGKRIITASEGSSPAIWNAETGEKIATAEGFRTTLPEFSPDGQMFAAGQGDRTTRFWQTEDGRLAKTLQLNSIYPDDVAFSPDGSRLLVVAWVDGGSLLDIENGNEIAALRGHTSNTHTGTFNHDGQVAATVAIDGSARLWNGVSGALMHLLGDDTGMTDADLDVNMRHQEIDGAFSPDDHLFATGSATGLVRIWDVATGSLVDMLQGHRGVVEHVEFRPDGRHLLTASHDGTARLWDIDGALTTTLGHQHPPTFVAFSPDGSRVVTGGGDAVGHIWDVASGSEIAALEGHGGGLLQDAIFHPDGTRVALIAFQIFRQDLSKLADVVGRICAIFADRAFDTRAQAVPDFHFFVARSDKQHVFVFVVTRRNYGD